MFGLTKVPTKEEALAGMSRMQNRLAKVKEKGEAMAGKAIHGAEIVGAAFGLGYLNGSKGTASTADSAVGETVYQVAGYDVAIGVAVVGIGLGLTEALGKHSDHALFIGLGAAANWAGREGYAKGVASLTAT